MELILSCLRHVGYRGGVALCYLLLERGFGISYKSKEKSNFPDQFNQFLVVGMKKLVFALLFLFSIGIVGVVWAENSYPYWIEDAGGDYYIWTKVNVSANSNITLYIRKVEGYQPDGDEVFEFFDDFEGNVLDSNKWTSSGNIIVSNSVLTVGDESYVYANFNLPQKLIIEVYITDTSVTNYAGLGIFSNYNNVKPHFYQNGYGFSIYEDYESHWTYDSADSSGTRHYLDNEYKEPLKITMKYDGTTAYWVSELGNWSQTLNLDITNYKLKIASGDYSGSSYIKVDYIFVRKYADQEPTVSVEQINDNTWKVIITNPNPYDLTNFQVKIDGTGIVESKTDSLLITDTISNELSFKVISTELKPHNVVCINITNYTGDVSKFNINWGDGTTTELDTNETLATHTYSWEDTFKIVVSSLDAEGNILAVNSTTVKVVYNISEIPYKYLIKVANPTDQNFTNYPLRIVLNSNNFDFFIPKPLGSDIYFRDENGTIYMHFIENYSIADQQAVIWVQIPYIAPNSYAEFYLCIDRDGHDRKQYTFDTSTTSPYILYTIIPEFGQPPEFGNITRVSSTTNDYKNCSILILDELGYIKVNNHKGTIRVINDKGEKIIYTFNEGYIGGIIQVPASTDDGLLIFLTDDGIMRKIHYNVSKINIILVPNGGFAPVLLKGGGGKKWLIYKNDGSFVTLANDESVVQLAVGGEYDFYLEDGTLIKKDYMVLGNGDVIYAKTTLTYSPTLITQQQIFQNGTVKFTVVTNRNITIEFSYNGTKENVTVGAGTWGFVKPKGTDYTIYVNGQNYKTGTLGGENWGLLGEVPKEFPNLAKWLGFGIIILVLLAGSFITIYVAVPMAVIAALVLIRLGWIELDPLTTSIFILIGLASFAYFYLKRNW